MSIYKFRKVLFFVGLCFQLSLSYSHPLNPLQLQEIKKHTDKISPGFSEDNLRLGAQCFASIGSDTFFNVEGTNMVFLIKQGKANRLDKSVFHGSTFYRHFFAYNSVLYLLGGYGMFNTHANMQYFSFDSKEWEIRKTTGHSPEFINSYLYKNGNYIYTGYNFKHGNGVYPNLMDKHVYRLHLKSFVWEELPLKINPEIEVLQNQEIMKNASVGAYTLYNSDLWGIVMDTLGRASKFLLHPKGLRGQFKCFGFINPDTLIVIISGSTPGSNHLSKLSLGQLMKDATPLFVAKEENNQRMINSFVGMLAGGMGVMGLLYFGFRFHKKRKEVARTRLEKLMLPYFEALRKYKGKTVTAEYLDELLGIHHMELGSKRMKRHRLLTDLNQVRPNMDTIP